MKIWIDGQCLQTASRKRGIGRYVLEFIRAINERRDIHLSISFNAALGEEAIAARDAVSPWISSDDIHIWHGLAHSGEMHAGFDVYRKLSEVAIAHHVDLLRVDLALSASPFEGANDIAVPLLPSVNAKTPVAAIFYDAIPLRFSDQYLTSSAAKEFYLRRLEALRLSALNLCISKFSQEESRNLLPGVPAINIMAGVSPDFLALAEIEHSKCATLVGGRQFALYVGGLDWRKNVEVIIDAFAIASQKFRENAIFVMAGDHPLDMVQQLKLRWVSLGLDPSKLLFLGHVSDEQLVALYKQARVVIQPSLMEGFGLTVLEAMTCNAAVIASNTGAMPEVVGDPAWLFDPESAAQLATLLERAFWDDAAVAKAIQHQESQAQNFSWQQTARIAAAGLKGLAIRADPTPPHSVMLLRSAVATKVAGMDLSDRLIARTLALTEPELPKGRRLIVDATQTARADHGTGIQRVVNLICKNLPSSVKALPCERIVAGNYESTDWFRLSGGNGSAYRLPPVREREPLQFGNRDTILMLDSSWELWSQHARSLLSARMRGGEVISCLYDMVPLTVPAFCDDGMPPMFSEWFRAALRVSTGFVCISRAVADELLKTLHAIGFPRPMKVGYWRLGADFITKEMVPTVSASDISTPMFLMVGTLEPRKGHEIAIKAFDRLWQSGADAALTICGKRGWGVDGLVHQIRSHPEFGRRLFWRDSIGDVELQREYHRCRALIAASYAEGFGLPIVEAGRFGKHVIVSDIPVFREVAAGAPRVRFFATGDSYQLAEEVLSVLNEKVRDGEALQSPSPSWPSWTESAAELEDVILNDHWYATYQPSERRMFCSVSELGQLAMSRPIPESARSHSLEFVSGPYYDENKSIYRYILRVTNESSECWSSVGAPDGTLGINISYFVRGRGGEMIHDDNPRVRFPFVLAPSSVCYLPLEVPAYWVGRGGRKVEIALVQEGIAWWKKGVTAELVP